jgi:hypothetical protein
MRAFDDDGGAERPIAVLGPIIAESRKEFVVF